MGKVILFAYLGVDDQGKLQLYVSSQQLNVIGTRLEKGSRFSNAIYDFIEEPGDSLAAPALRSLQDYFNGEDHRSGGLTFGEKLTKRKRK